MPRYDVAQLITYLFLLDQREGDIVEAVKNSSGHTSGATKAELLTMARTDPDTIRVTAVPFDHLMWDQTIMPRIQLFASALDLFMADPHENHVEYVGRTDPQHQRMMIKEYWERAATTTI